jgi:hypothetical protein
VLPSHGLVGLMTSLVGTLLQHGIKIVGIITQLATFGHNGERLSKQINLVKSKSILTYEDAIAQTKPSFTENENGTAFEDENWK